MEIGYERPPLDGRSGFDSLILLYQEVLRVSIHNFLSWRKHSRFGVEIKPTSSLVALFMTVYLMPLVQWRSQEFSRGGAGVWRRSHTDRINLFVKTISKTKIKTKQTMQIQIIIRGCPMSIKDVHSADIFRTRGALQMLTSALFDAKNSGFFSKLMVCPHGQGGLSQCGPFSDKGRGGLIFYDFVQTSFMESPLLN